MVRPILSLPEGSEDFVVYCDASLKGFGAVLMQREKVIAYASRQLRKNEVIHDPDLEFGAVVFAFEYGDIFCTALSVRMITLCYSLSPGKAYVVADAFKQEGYGTDSWTLVSHQGFGGSLPKKSLADKNLDMSTAFHPETDGQSERTIQTLEDMFAVIA
ncbi:putative reverse transcriptase domain-containing protein [Tanacetum coccineum]